MGGINETKAQASYPILDDSVRFAEQHVGEVLHTPGSGDGENYRFIVRTAGRFGNGARSSGITEVTANTRREAELKRLRAVALRVADYLQERIEAERAVPVAAE